MPATIAPGSHTRSAQNDIRPGSRADEILDLIHPVVVDQGLAGVSMQQLAQAAGMSAGNFYRYFPSRDAIIEALVERDLQDLEQRFATVRDSADPRQAFRDILTERLSAVSEDMRCPMLIEIEAAALRQPAIHQLLQRLDTTIERNLTELFQRLSQTSTQDHAEIFATHAHLLQVLVKGVMREAQLAASHEPGTDATDRVEALANLVLDTVDSMLDRVVQQAANR